MINPPQNRPNLIERVTNTYQTNPDFRGAVNTGLSTGLVYGLGELVNTLVQEPNMHSNLQFAYTTLSPVVGAYYSRGIQNPPLRTLFQIALATFFGYEMAGAIANYQGGSELIRNAKQAFSRDSVQNISAAAAGGLATLLRLRR